MPTTDFIVLFRIGERLTLTLVVLVVSAIVMVGFWRTVQRIDLTEGGKLGVAGSFAFSTPVFVLLTIVGYAYVSLSAPINVTQGGNAAQTDLAGTPSSSFIGASPTAMSAPPSADPDYDSALAERKIRSLNCMARGRELSPRQQDDLALVKLDLMAPIWAADWGDPDSFRAWAAGIDPAAPNSSAQRVFESEHPLC